MTSHFPTTSKTTASVTVSYVTSGLYWASLLLMSGCSTTTPETNQRPITGAISYPFVGETRPIGKTNPRQPFVVRSAVGAREYSVEIPDNSAKYDIQIPVAELTPAGDQSFASSSFP